MLLSRRSGYLTNDKECMTPAMKICKSGKAHAFEEVTAPGIMLILAINMQYFFENQIRAHIYFFYWNYIQLFKRKQDHKTATFNIFF